jgi:UMF1 family MFS transporter|tara:strand:- start:42618 stop:43838 length:1221 start_codon:yes stop_codon:yes gene_type:complete
MPKSELSRSKLSIASWVIYDMGNTLFSAGIVGLIFPLWLTRDMAGNDGTFGFSLSISMVVVFILSPVAGTISDVTKRKMPFLLFTTLVAIFATALIGVFNYEASIVLFCAAVILIHLANIFYNALLADITTESNVGYIGGLGVGIGYIGAIFAVVCGLLFYDSEGPVFLFKLMALLMFILVLPLFLSGNYFIGNTKITEFRSVLLTTLKQAFLSLWQARKKKPWAMFLFARFWYFSSIYAGSVFAVLYGVETVDLSEREVQLILAVGIIFGIPSGAFWGYLVDRYGSFFNLKINVLAWFLILGLAALLPVFDLPGELWWAVGVMSGVFMAGLYVSERPFVLSMSASDRVSEYFAVYNMVGRLAAITGPFAWGYISSTLGLGQVASITWLSICSLIGFLILVCTKLE